MPEPLSTGVAKLLSTLLTFGLGPLLAPWQSRRLGIADAHNLLRRKLAEAQADKLIEEINAGTKAYEPKSGELVDVSTYPHATDDVAASARTSTEAEELFISISTARIARELKSARNLLSTLDFAREEMEEDQGDPISEDDIEVDWFERWRRGAEEVSNEDIQRLWGRLLAKEIRRPGSFHLRTLELLRTLSFADAKLIERVLQFAIGGQTLLRDTACIHRNGVPYSELAQLEELGIIGSLDAGSGRIFKWDLSRTSFTAGLFFGDKLGLLVVARGDNHVVKIPSIPLTRVGRELCFLGKFSDPPMDYIQEVADALKRDNAEVMVQLAEKQTAPNGAMNLVGVRVL